MSPLVSLAVTEPPELPFDRLPMVRVDLGWSLADIAFGRRGIVLLPVGGEAVTRRGQKLAGARRPLAISDSKRLLLPRFHADLQRASIPAKLAEARVNARVMYQVGNLLAGCLVAPKALHDY